MNNTEKSYKKLPPFKGWVLQNFPFIEEDFDALTNYQMMCKVTEYLKVIQNNVDYIQDEEITPLYNAFVELKNYVDDYFENLDIQTEIDNKLDEMAESGQLADIIAQYLQVNSVLGFDTKASLKSAENLVNGSITRTLGTNSYNDGKGNYYKIRTITSGDIIDDDNILALANYPTLIAEKMPDYRMNQVESDIDEINNTTIPNIEEEIANLSLGKYLIIGDSFIAQYNDNWATKLQALLGLSNNDITILGEGGAGVYNVGNQGTNFLGLLQANIDNITDKDEYKNIIVGGGYNDGNATSINEILTPLESLINYCKVQFPNAKIYFSAFGWNMKYDGVTFRQRINGIVIPAYKQASKFGGYYLSNTEFCYRDTSLYETNDPVSSSMVHPNDNGQREIAQAIYEALHTGYTPRYKSSNIAFSTTSDIISANCYFTHAVTPFNHQIGMNGNFTISKTYVNNDGLNLDLGVMNDPYLRRSSDNYNNFANMHGRVYDTSNRSYDFMAALSYDSNGHIKLQIPRGLTSGNVSISSFVISDATSFDRYMW